MVCYSGTHRLASAGASRNARRLATMLVEGVDGEAAEQLGIEVGGFLRKDFASERDIANLTHAAGIHQKSHVGIAGADRAQGLGGVADVGEVLLVTNGFLREAEDVFQKDLVQLDDVEGLLAD